MLIQIQNSSNKIYNSDTMIQEPDIEMGLDLIKLKNLQQSYLKNQKEKQNISILSKILIFLNLRT